MFNADVVSDAKELVTSPGEDAWSSIQKVAIETEKDGILIRSQS
jgi:hypothetical protein